MIFTLLAENILSNQHGGHVSGKRHILPGLCIFAVYAETVCIRVRGKHKVCILFFCKFQRKLPCIRIFRVRIRRRREMSVRNSLLRLNVYILKSQILKHPLNRLKTRTVKRRINNLNVLSHLLYDFRMDGKGTQCRKVFLVQLLPDNIVQSCRHGSILIHCLYHGKVCYFLDLCHNAGIMRRRHLRAVLPVYLVSVVFPWVMACRNDNSCNTAKLPYCKGKLRYRAESGKDIGFYAVCRKCERRCIRKFIRHQA